LRILLPLLVALGLALSQAAYSDALDAANWARLRGCKAPLNRVSLRNNLQLQKAAARLADGAALHDALAAVGYLASESSELHFSGAANDQQVGRILSANYCATLTDPKLQEIGAERRGRDLWMVLAAPVAMPAAGDADSVNRLILALVNKARAAGRRCGAKFFAPVMPLTLNLSLTSAALAHSRDMAKNAAFDHRGGDGSSPAVRVQRAGFGAYSIVGENIAAGAMTPAEVVAGWLASPAHCANIMDARFTDLGSAYAANLSTAAGLFWTQDFAASR
jgi:uncharacterized protein YkwD